MADDRRWFDASQPQTLQGAVILSYITAVFGIIDLLLYHVLVLVLIPLALGVAGFGVANEKRWGYRVGVAVAVLNVLWNLFLTVRFGGFGIIGLLFAGILVALFLHPQSREYEKIWFR